MRELKTSVPPINSVLGSAGLLLLPRKQRKRRLIDGAQKCAGCKLLPGVSSVRPHPKHRPGKSEIQCLLDPRRLGVRGCGRLRLVGRQPANPSPRTASAPFTSSARNLFLLGVGAALFIIPPTTTQEDGHQPSQQARVPPSHRLPITDATPWPSTVLLTNGTSSTHAHPDCGPAPSPSTSSTSPASLDYPSSVCLTTGPPPRTTDHISSLHEAPSPNPRVPPARDLTDRARSG